MGKKQRKNDVIFIGAMLLIAVLFFVGMKIYQNYTTKDGVVVVTVNGDVYGTYPLTEDRKEKIVMEDGSFNLLLIQDGKADVTDASCRDKICVNHRPVSKNGESIVCLPNKMVAGIENGEESEVDSLTN